MLESTIWTLSKLFFFHVQTVSSLQEALRQAHVELDAALDKLELIQSISTEMCSMQYPINGINNQPFTAAVPRGAPI
jgi:hypothetical protein